MLESDKQAVPRQNPKCKVSVLSCLVSLVSVFFTQFSLSSLSLFLPTSSFVTLLPLSALLLVIVIGLGRFWKRVCGVRASAPAYVFFSILFIWALYVYVVRQAISSLLDIAFNIAIVMVTVGLCRIISSDPGFFQRPLHEVESQEEEMKVSTSVVRQESQAEEAFTQVTQHKRVRYCRHCKNYVMGFDHHCPAFGNCIGQRNHALFLVLLMGFAVSEASYVVSAIRSKSQTSKEVGWEATTSGNLVVGAMLFCLIQVLWQVVFIMWHVYCACYNIKTDEWINWRKYPEFHIKVIPGTVEPEVGNGIQFINPYDKGILRNLREFLSGNG